MKRSKSTKHILSKTLSIILFLSIILTDTSTKIYATERVQENEDVVIISEPKIEKVTATKAGKKCDGYTIFTEAVDILVNVECENIKDFKTQIEVELIAYDGNTGENLSITKPEICEDTIKKNVATFKFSFPKKETDIYIGAVVAKNLTDVNTPILSVEKELKYNIKITDPEAGNPNSTFKISDGNGWESNGSDNKWYSATMNTSEEKDLDLQIDFNTFDKITDVVVTDYNNNTINCVSNNQTISLLGYDNFIPKFSSTYTYQYKLQTTEDGIHEYNVSYKANGIDYEEKICTYIDNTPPKVTIRYFKAGNEVFPNRYDDSYYNGEIEVVATIVDPNFTADNPELSHLVINGSLEQFSEWIQNEDGSFSSSVILATSGRYSVTGYVSDSLGNNSEERIDVESFTIISTNPVVDLYFDNNDVRNEKYYNASRKATIIIDTYDFNPNNVKLTIDKGFENAVIGEWTEDIESGNYYLNIIFEKEGNYHFTCKYTDPVNTESNIVDSGEFVIDTTAPVLNVSYDNNDYKNDFYYNVQRTAKITVDDASYSDSLLTVLKQSDASLNSIPSVEKSSTDNTASIKFDKDGKYGFTIVCEDLAGNPSEMYISDIFVIDMTSPEIVFAGVDNFSANNGKVEPVVKITDSNMNSNTITTSIVGFNNGNIKMAETTSLSDEDITVSYSDFPYDKEYDDLYTLSVSISDLAGNESNSELVFSVNRFGSVYVISDSTKNLIDKYYLTEPQDIVITEINVDSIVYKEVDISCDGNIKDLHLESDYSIKEHGSEKTWKSVDYIINKNNFIKDGIYSVIIYSEDKASNKQNNQSKDAEVKFAVDKTAPSVVIAGLEDNGVYEEATHEFAINVTDNMALKSVTVYVNDKVVNKYSEDELSENGGTQIITLQENKDVQNIKIECFDIAGNKTVITYKDVIIYPRVSEEMINMTENDIPKSDISSMEKTATAVAVMEQSIEISKTVWGVIVICSALIVTETSYLLYRKKKKRKTKVGE